MRNLIPNGNYAYRQVHEGNQCGYKVVVSLRGWRNQSEWVREECFRAKQKGFVPEGWVLPGEGGPMRGDSWIKVNGKLLEADPIMVENRNESPTDC